jgi:hypothetical protein
MADNTPTQRPDTDMRATLSAGGGDVKASRSSA